MKYILPPEHRTGNPTPEDSPLPFNWDSVRTDQPNYLRIDKEVLLDFFVRLFVCAFNKTIKDGGVASQQS